MISPLQYSTPSNWQRLGSLEKHNGCNVKCIFLLTTHRGARRRSIISRRYGKSKKTCKTCLGPFWWWRGPCLCKPFGIALIWFKSTQNWWFLKPQSLFVCHQGWRAPEELTVLVDIYFTRSNGHCERCENQFLKIDHDLAWAVNPVPHLAHQGGSPAKKIFWPTMNYFS